MNNLSVATIGLLLLSCARNGAVSPADVSALYRQLNEARAALPSLAPKDQAPIGAAIDKTEAAIRHLVDVAARGQDRRASDDFLRAVVGVAMASPGIVADDVIVLPIAVLALLATRVLTEAPAPPAELSAAWDVVRARLNELSMAVTRARARAKRLPPRSNCQAHLDKCLASPLQSVWGGKYGRSVCLDCMDLCRGQGAWPARTGDGKECQWWNVQ